MLKVPLEPPVTMSTAMPCFSKSSRVRMSRLIQRFDDRRRSSKPITCAQWPA
jgi:hypothetical protein